MRHVFQLKIHPRSTHFVNVVLHSTRTVMRGQLRRLGHESKNTNAACWQPNKSQVDGCIAEVHFARTHLTIRTIAHEMSHAAHHRARMIGIPLTDYSFQEYVAEDTGTLTDACIAYFDERKIDVRYAVVPGRVITSRRKK